MSTWPKSDPERHYENAGGQWCAACGYVIGGRTWNAMCTPDSPCRCCLVAEVETLRATVNRALSMLDSAMQFERNIGDYLTLTQISQGLRDGLRGTP